jgi:hypothetical protein
MRQFLGSRRPSPALAVAFVALVAALSGTAVALPGKNTVDSGDIKKNAVRSADIKNGGAASADLRNNGVTSADVRDNALTGTDIDEASIGTVPSANSANSATNATNAANATNARTAANADALGGQPAGAYEGPNETIPFSFTMGEGERTVATVGPLRVHTECDLDVDDGGGFLIDVGRILVSTSEDNSTFDDNHQDEFSDWDVADSPALAFSNDTDADDFDIEATGNGAGAIATAPGGASLTITNEAVGLNLFDQPDTCYFAGVVVVLGGSAS